MMRGYALDPPGVEMSLLGNRKLATKMSLLLKRAFSALAELPEGGMETTHAALGHRQ